MLPEIVVDAPEALGDRLASLFEDEGREAIAVRGLFAVALPGGSLATAFFPRLARLRFDWTRVEFFWGDERAVPASDPDSNYGSARALWLDPAGVPPERVHPMQVDPEAYAGELQRVLGARPRLDLALLGVGPDGHVCSLFPGHALLREEQRLVAVIDDAPKPPPRRMTLTLPLLTASRLVIVAALGAGKAEAIRHALSEPDSPLPVALALRHARRAILLLDAEAARLL